MAAAAFIVFGGITAVSAAGPGARGGLDQFADRANFAGVSAAIEYKRFIVTYTEGSAERAQASAREGDFARVAAETGLRVQHVRTLSTGAELVEVAGDKLRFAGYDEVQRQVLVAFARNAAV
ncbi:MAG TPA: hypothetical protein VLK83_08545 [Rhodanobacteraceae bacterium]|nr:hypothetical protein [Rhodanobacteraceae bacterium]